MKIDRFLSLEKLLIAVKNNFVAKLYLTQPNQIQINRQTS